MIVCFIGGTGRCGTSVLRDVLGLHPEIYYIPTETYPRPLDSNCWPKWRSTTYADAMTRAEEAKAKVLLEKTPQNALFAEQLLSWKPYTKYLHITRDKDAVAKSIVRHGSFSQKSTGYILNEDVAAAYWEFVELHFAHTKGKWPRERVGCVWLEHLVRHPVPTLEGICEWLGIAPPTFEMMDYPFDVSRVETDGSGKWLNPSLNKRQESS